MWCFSNTLAELQSPASTIRFNDSPAAAEALLAECPVKYAIPAKWIVCVSQRDTYLV